MKSVTVDFSGDTRSSLSLRKLSSVDAYSLIWLDIPGMSVPEMYMLMSSAYWMIEMPGGGLGMLFR